jgi:glycosyltransferase involved in cell wall biosynthesis
MQKANFSFEILINDDASTDKTQKILQKYATSHSNIKLVIQKENQWKEGMLNGTFFGWEPFINNLLPIAKGKYIAFCEGDDYWTDPLKLQKQVDYLESHPDCTMCYHSYSALQNNKIVEGLFDKEGKYYTGKELISVPPGIHSSTKMFRNIFNEEMREEIAKFSGDYLFTSYLGTLGDCGFVVGIGPSIYRLHKAGIWIGLAEDVKKVRYEKMLKDLYNLYLEIGNEEAANIRKSFISDNPTFGIILPTYQRRDKKTSVFLKRALDSIFAQICKNFKVYIIGDKYEPEEELSKIVSNYPSQQIYYENLPIAKEREKYKDNPKALWCAGGTFAHNYGISKAESDGIKYICFLDHDDYWLPNHLQILYDAILSTNADWFCTKSTHAEREGMFLPFIKTDKAMIEYLPTPERVIKSSACFNLQTIPLRFRDVFAETGAMIPGDSDLWKRSAEFIKSNNLKSYYLNTHTCIHESEGFEKLWVTLITPTGDRPEAFELTRRWIFAQTRKFDQWIVVDDGFTPLPERLRVGVDYIRRTPTDGEGCTLNVNLATALPFIKGRKILIIEDDDWYGPNYIKTMLEYLNTYNLVGEGNARYFNLCSMKGQKVNNEVNISLCQTGFDISLLPTFKECIPGNPFIDIRFWRSVLDNKYIFFDSDDKLHLHCSMKGLRGRKGIAMGHNPNDPFFNIKTIHSKTNGLQLLINWVGIDNAKIYLAHLNKTVEKERVIKLTWRDKISAFPQDRLTIQQTTIGASL